MDDLIVHDATIMLYLQPVPAGEEDTWNISNSYTVIKDSFSLRVFKLQAQKLLSRAFNGGIDKDKIKIQWFCPEYNPIKELTEDDVLEMTNKCPLKCYKVDAHIKPVVTIDYINIDIKVHS